MLVKNILEIIPSILIYAVLYLIANKVQLITPTKVPMTYGDELFQFNPHWVLIYFSSYISIPMAYLLLFYQNGRMFIRSFLSLTFLSFFVFMLFPTIVSRSDFQSVGMNPIYQFLFNILHSADSPTNCIPSLHVSTAFLIFYLSFSYKNKLLIMGTLIYAILVSLSTLYVKQHLLLDVYTGFLAASVIALLNYYWEKKNGKNTLE
tara:strand:- start:1157 stop:1771 length:615 start_codon:yes stop_codon:yes gene_type:complete